VFETSKYKYRDWKDIVSSAHQKKRVPKGQTKEENVEVEKLKRFVKEYKEAYDTSGLSLVQRFALGSERLELATMRPETTSSRAATPARPGRNANYLTYTRPTVE